MWQEAEKHGAVRTTCGINWAWAYFPTIAGAQNFKEACEKAGHRTNPLREVTEGEHKGLHCVHYHL